MSRSVRSWLNWLAAAAVLIAAMLALAPVAHAQDKSLFWEKFDVDIEVNADGTFDVAEYQTIQFTSGTFTFGFREIPINNFNFIDNWAISDSQGNTYTESTYGDAPYTFTVSEGDSYVVKWYFPPTGYTSETYTLRYTVHGGLRYYDGGDQVWWKAIFADRAFPVEDGRVRVIVPPGARVQEYQAYINAADARFCWRIIPLVPIVYSSPA